jgi:hypothetical protein
MDLELVAGAVARAVRGPGLSLFSGLSRHSGVSSITASHFALSTDSPRAVSRVL